MIRPAEAADIPALLEMGHRFATATELDAKTGFDPTSVEGLFEHLISNPMGLLLVLDIDGPKGGAGGLVHPSIFNGAHLTGQELFWWVDPEARGNGLRLFQALEKAAQGLGAQSWIMSTVGIEDERIGAIYERAGYQLTDRNYFKTF